MIRLSRWLALAVVAVVVPASSLFAAPTDSKVGDVRVTFAKAGTPIRSDANALAAPVGAPLPAGTSVTLLEVKLPWIKVRTASNPPVEGWLKAYETVEPSALAGTPPPPHLTGVPPGTVTQQQVSAAGRQFSENTERGYRVSRKDLELGYRYVDRMEADTAALDMFEMISFVVDGNLGRRGRAYDRPARLPPVPEESREPLDLGKVADVLDKVDDLPGPLGKLFGGKKPKVPGDAKKALRIVGAAAQAQRALQKMNEGFNTTQEYYIGRAVAAQAIAKYGIDPDENRRRYVRFVGDAIVRLSDRVPANHGGYHFDVLNSMEVNAVSGPGGYVLVTRGAVEACRDEEELAGIIAHELAHVTLSHGTKILRQGPKFQQGRQEFLDAIAKGLDETGVAPRMVNFFGDSVGELSGRAVGHDYGQAFEFEADLEGTYLLYDVLYRASAIRDELRHLGETGQAHGGAQHASPQVRAQALERALAPLQMPPNMAAIEQPRKERFAVTMRRTPPPPPVVPPTAPPPTPPSGPSSAGGPPPPPPPIPLPPR